MLRLISPTDRQRAFHLSTAKLRPAVVCRLCNLDLSPCPILSPLSSLRRCSTSNSATQTDNDNSEPYCIPTHYNDNDNDNGSANTQRHLITNYAGHHDITYTENNNNGLLLTSNSSPQDRHACKVSSKSSDDTVAALTTPSPDAGPRFIAARMFFRAS